MGALKGLRRTGLALLTLVLLVVALDRIFPPPLATSGTPGAVVLARDGTPLRAFAASGGVWRYPVAVTDVSPLYLEALLGYEDRWFHRHPGVNPVALMRAAWQGVRHGRRVSGGSTLTMQVARILDRTPHTWTGKLRQILRALQLELRLSKTEILTLYLNHAPFGGTIEGVEAAAWAWLGKSSARLSHAEAALLAVLPQAPSRLRPDRHPKAAQVARDKVLARMEANGTWSARAVADARQEGVAARRLEVPLHAPLLARRLHQDQPHVPRIHSTLDAGLQIALERRVAGYLQRLPERTSAALLVVDNESLEARAYVGSADIADASRLGHVDMVRAWRSPGSTLKPFLYGMALDDGLIHSESLLIDAPQSFGGYRPGNFGLAFHGPVSAAGALQASLNVPAVDLLARTGPARFAARLAHAGLELRLPRGARPQLAVILGGAGIRLEDLAGAWTALARQGVAGRVRYTVDAPLVERRLLSPGAAWIVRRILEDNPRPGQAPGTFDTGSRAAVAWKTGTSYGFRDTWAVGGTRSHTVVVWIGRPDGTPLPGQYGALTALPLFFQVVDGLPRNPGRGGAEPPPASVARVDICWPTGLAAAATADGLCHRRRSAWVLDGQIPPTAPERDARRWRAGVQRVMVDAGGRRLSAGCSTDTEMGDIAVARWPVLAEPWLDAGTRERSRLPALAPGCAPDQLEADRPLHIDGLVDGSRIARPPGRTGPPRVRLRARGAAGDVTWLLDGRLAGRTIGGEAFEPVFDGQGEYTITALDDHGAWDRIHVQVLR